MKRNELTKDRFVKITKNIQTYIEWTNSVYDLGITFDESPDLTGDLIDLLDMWFGNYDSKYGGAVSYFVFDLDFGKDYYEGCFMDGERNIDLSSVEKVWEYLNEVNDIQQED